MKRALAMSLLGALGCGGPSGSPPPVTVDVASGPEEAAPVKATAHRSPEAVCEELARLGVVGTCEVPQGEKAMFEEADRGSIGFRPLPETGEGDGRIVGFSSEKLCRGSIDEMIDERPEAADYVVARCDEGFFVVVVDDTWKARRKIAEALGVEVGEDPRCPPGFRSEAERCIEPKIKQCNRLIGVTNHLQGRIADLNGTSTEELERLAKTLDEVAAALRAVRLDDLTLVRLRDDYVQMASNLASTSRTARMARDAKDESAVKLVTEEMESFTPREDAIVDAINRYCSNS